VDGCKRGERGCDLQSLKEVVSLHLLPDVFGAAKMCIVAAISFARTIEAIMS